MRFLNLKMVQNLKISKITFMLLENIIILKSYVYYRITLLMNCH